MTTRNEYRTDTIHPMRPSTDVELGSDYNGTREVVRVSGIGGSISFELYETACGEEHYEGRTNCGRYASEWLQAAE
jgi:hypothetical protein